MPNRAWSSEITKLKASANWTCDELHVILDVHSHYVVGRMFTERENANFATKRIDQSVVKQRIDRGQLTIHADCGSSRTSKDVASLLADLGITQMHSRPHVSIDNSNSEAQARTLKDRLEFPEHAPSVEPFSMDTPAIIATRASR